MSLPLTADRVRPVLRTRWLGTRYVWLEECTSTNDVAAALAREGAAEGAVVVADRQGRGRGRLGRSWHSPSGVNLHVSILLRPARPAVEVPPLTLVAGAAVARALAGFGLAPRLKWPNDVLVAAPGGALRKVAGVLTEMASEAGRVEHVVVGIGVNVGAQELPEELADRATSVAAALGASGHLDATAIDRRDVLARLLEELERGADRFRAGGPPAAVEDWEPHAAIGTRWRVRAGAGTLVGTALGLDGDGALLLRDDEGVVHRLVSGELE